MNNRQLRRERRRKKKGERMHNDYYWRKNRNGERCNSCGGQMSWCSCCECWTKICCVPYGTCMCS